MPGSDDRVSLAASGAPSDARRILLARICIAVVLAWNVQCGVAFLLDPATYVVGFELRGAAGEAAVRGIGLLFLMWNVPYAVALWHPARRRVSLWEALAMQAIGLTGESLILLSLPAAVGLARASLTRFVMFDAAGLVLLAVALWLTRTARTIVRRPAGH